MIYNESNFEPTSERGAKWCWVASGDGRVADNAGKAERSCSPRTLEVSELLVTSRGLKIAPFDRLGRKRDWLHWLVAGGINLCGAPVLWHFKFDTVLPDKYVWWGIFDYVDAALIYTKALRSGFRFHTQGIKLRFCAWVGVLKRFMIFFVLIVYIEWK